MAKTKTILLVYTNFSTFVQTDFEILSSEYIVIKYQFKPVRNLFRNTVEIIRQFLFLCINIHRIDVCFVWFADYHSLLPVLFSRSFTKRSYVVIGGYDVCRIKKLKYGAFCSRFRGFFTVNSMKNCSYNLAVSTHVKRKVKSIAPSAPVRLIHNCVNINNIADNSPVQKENLVLTVAVIENSRTFFVKGIDTFIQVARLMPSYRFIVVGINSSVLGDLVSDLPQNIELTGKIDHKGLTEYYEKAKIYCQLSRSESFGISILEAMTMGCYPVVTNEGGMPEIIGNSGSIVKREATVIAGEIENIANLYQLSEVLDTNSSILSNYSINIRRDSIHQLINSGFSSK